MDRQTQRLSDGEKWTRLKGKIIEDERNARRGGIKKKILASPTARPNGPGRDTTLRGRRRAQESVTDLCAQGPRRRTLKKQFKPGT